MDDAGELTWRDKIAILDVTGRIAVSMFLTIVVLCRLLMMLHG